MTDPEGQEPTETEGTTDTGTTTDTQDTKDTSKPRATGGTHDAINSNLDDIDDVDTLKGMVKSLRVENGNHRRKNKDLGNEFESLKAWKLDHMKGLAEAEERVAKADAIAKRYVIRTIAQELDIDDDLVDLITGDTEEELWEKGERLANTKKKDTEARNPLEPGWLTGPTNLMPGKRGNPIRPDKPKPSDDSQWLRDAWSRGR